jgi:hypothetical protein
VQSEGLYPLAVTARVPGTSGSIQLERIEGGRTLMVVELSGLPPPQQIASDLTDFVVWLEDATGAQVNVGPMRYDRARARANLLTTTHLRSFTVRVTGERTSDSQTPSDVVLASRNVTTH